MRHSKNYLAAMFIGLTSLFSCGKDEVIISEPEIEKVIVQVIEYYAEKSQYSVNDDGTYYITEDVSFLGIWDNAHKSDVVVNGKTYPTAKVDDYNGMVVSSSVVNNSVYRVGVSYIDVDTLNIVCTLYNEGIKE